MGLRVAASQDGQVIHASERYVSEELLKTLTQQLENPGWAWRPQRDTIGVLIFCGIAGCCTLAACALLCVAWAVRRSRRDNDGAATTGCCASAAASWVRIGILVFIGFCPLFCCLAIGEGFQHVLWAMTTMHWGAMMLIPVAYYVARSFEDSGSENDGTNTTLAFYSALWAEQTTNFWRKALRGMFLGVPIFLLFMAGFLLVRCETWHFPFCIRSFEKPLVEYGFEPHSMSFRVMAASYFTFVNPIFEEFFWRVFLHRELCLECGLEWAVELSTEDEYQGLVVEAESHAWRRFFAAITALVPGVSHSDKTEHVVAEALVRWGVCMMYASYHLWPIKVLFRSVFEVWAVPCYLGLVVLGRFFLILRETLPFGLPAAVVAHVWVDAAFAVICIILL
eukprot:gnl/TRDRNA2_/TRDRNA2_82131_c0_seq1.p1 gnl/TRDRNA2_/TRDRNA2_82131_c0~~gnl/TRDRNA2_/TRDRNA2_82131_c0_seq1.p1  ORF type:complete len:394 (-),score=44.64 gnl/TRDRNA2_/TRDRNA2_82131_c0_seq1:40-1221(-)